MKKILKKILALVIILGIFSQVSSNSFASYNYELENAKYYIFLQKKQIIENIKGGDKFIEKIDGFIEKINDNKAKILKKKLNIIIEKIGSKKIKSKKEEKILLIINYINYKLKIRDLIKKEEEKKNIFKNTLSKQDTEKVNKQLVKFQNNLLNSGVKYYENILGKLKNKTNYDESGNFKASVKFDIPNIGKSDSSLQLKDYVAKKSLFDEQLKTKIEAIIDATLKGQKEVKLQISAFIDYIFKDQNYYLLLKDLKITNEKNIEEFKQFIEKAKEIASKNKYIHFKNRNADEIFSILKQLNPENILRQGKTIASKPLFTAYKKEGNKYYLVPSKYACDTFKTLSNKFDPFNGSKCTDSQYQDLLSYIADTKGEFYIDFLGKNTIIGFEADNIKLDIEKFNAYISFSDKYIEEIKVVLTPNQEKYKGEGAELHFVRAKKLDAKILVKDQKIDLSLKSTLDGANRFKTIDFKYNVGDELSSELTLKNRKIIGKYTINGYKSKFIGNISGTTDNSDYLTSLKIENKYVNSLDYNPGEINTILEYAYGKYTLKNISKSEGVKSDLLISAKIAQKRLVAGEIKLNVEQKEGKFDYDKYKMVYSGDFKKVVDGDIILKNQNITGKTTVFVNNKEYLTIKNKGKLKKDKFELNNKIEFTESPYQALNNNLGGSVRIAQNTKVRSDLSNIFAKINIMVAQGVPLKDFVGENNKINFKTLNEKEENFKQPDGSDYKIKIFIKGDFVKFSLLGYTIDENGNKIAVIKSNYYQLDKTYPESLFKINGKYIQNGDIIGKLENFKKEEIKKQDLKPEANVNIKTDTTGTRNYFNLYIDYKENDKKLLEIKLDNKSNKNYRDEKILAPLPNNTMELNEAIGNPYMY